MGPKDLPAYFEWYIRRHPDEVEGLVNARIVLQKEMVDLGVLKNMSKEDCKDLNIPWALGRRLSRDLKDFLK